MEKISIGIVDGHMRLHYGSFSAFWKEGSETFRNALRIIQKRNAENLDIHGQFQTILFEEDDFREGKLGFQLQKDQNQTVYPMPILSEEELDNEETRNRLIAAIDKEMEAAEEEDQGILELTRELVLPEPTEEELVRKDVEELIREVEEEREPVVEIPTPDLDNLLPMKKTQTKINRWLSKLKAVI